MALKAGSRKKEHSRSLFYRVSAWLHLWLGLVTGIVMVIVCVTGCLWVFQDEIISILEPETNVARQRKAIIRPSQILAITDKEYPGNYISYALFHQGKAIEVSVGSWRESGFTLKMDPYSGKIISRKERKEDEIGFFRWVLSGHRFLWLPYKIGRPIVNYSTLIFVLTLITGMVLWWPQKWTKSTREKSFSIKWTGTPKRVNYDLHNVLGFYALFFITAIGLTGMVWGIEWFSKGLYWTTSGGQSLPEWVSSQSDTLYTERRYTPATAADIAWNKVVSRHPDADGFMIDFPDSSDHKATIGLTVYPTPGQFYNNRGYTFDQYSVAELPGNTFYSGEYAKASGANKLRRLNYDIHVGAILGLPGKFLAFFASLIGATLPITGFIIWWGRRGFGRRGFGKRKKAEKGKAKKRNENVEKTPNLVRPTLPIRKSPVRVERIVTNIDSDSTSSHESDALR